MTKTNQEARDDERQALAQAFHEAYERLAPSHGYETRKASAVPWAEVPEPNRSLMVAVAGELLAAGYRKRPEPETVADAEALIDLLHGLNARGTTPSVAFRDVHGLTGVAYGIDLGDEMGTAYLADPGENRYVEIVGEPGAEQYINTWERPVEELCGPIAVLYEGEPWVPVTEGEQ